ncbi:hypothetical protein C8Q75DRAFT_803923 [Abortiporus biennis]|nr:hypothetical protein C8Q75DRAFT_803923 [Abortiporus biennis]
MASISLELPQQSPPMATQNHSPQTELRHITSANNLASPSREHKLSNRNSQHLRTHRLGSRSPASIPSSPTSVHSSSSAIFERDIEPINPSPPLLHDPHRMPRGKNTEQLDQSVPSVLDSAAEILTASAPDEDTLDTISILAPIPLDDSRSGFTSPISRLSSRSPSPTGTRKSTLMTLPSPSPSFTLPLPLQQLHQLPPIPRSSSPQEMGARPTLHTSSPAPINETTVTSTPTTAYFSASEESSPMTATHSEHPLHTLSSPTSPISPGVSPAPVSPSATTLTAITSTSSHPPSPKNSASKRLSFISYTDLLSSTPASALPLSSLTLSAQVNEPPPHLASVIGFPQAQAQMVQQQGGAGSRANSIHAGVTNSSAGFLHPECDPAAKMVDDVGGEWEREGLGRGLEERMESLMTLSGKA